MVLVWTNIRRLGKHRIQKTIGYSQLLKHALLHAMCLNKATGKPVLGNKNVQRHVVKVCVLKQPDFLVMKEVTMLLALYWVLHYI